MSGYQGGGEFQYELLSEDTPVRSVRYIQGFPRGAEVGIDDDIIPSKNTDPGDPYANAK
jgi:hypothetical protein